MRRNPVDDRSGYQGLTHGSQWIPGGSVLKQIPYGNGQIMIGIEQPGAFGDNPVAIDIRIVAKGDIKNGE